MAGSSSTTRRSGAAGQGDRQLYGRLPQGLHPARLVTWDDGGNNEAFLAADRRHDAEHIALDPQRAQGRASRRLLQEHRDDRMATRPTGEAFPIEGRLPPAAVFKDGGNVATAKEFVRFLVAEGWLMHYLNFSGERMLPSIPALLDQPFWLDPSDRHHMAAVMQAQSRPLAHNYTAASGDLAARPDLSMNASGPRRSTASSPRTSAPSRRSTRRSPGSKRS